MDSTDDLAAAQISASSIAVDPFICPLAARALARPRMNAHMGCIPAEVRVVTGGERDTHPDKHNNRRAVFVSGFGGVVIGRARRFSRFSRGRNSRFFGFGKAGGNSSRTTNVNDYNLFGQRGGLELVNNSKHMRA